MENLTPSPSLPKPNGGDGPHPLKAPGEGGLPLRQAKPKVGDKIQFCGQLYVIRKITKKDMLLRPIPNDVKTGKI